ncbi:MAG TPA: hypothetical protein VIN06_20100 [Devosia sp.]
MYRTAPIVAAVAALSWSIAGTAVAAPVFECPDNLGSAGGAYQDNRYTAEYRSWNWEDEDHSRWYVCHCVRNLGRNAVKVNWPEVGLSGWIRLNSTLHFKTSVSENTFETRDTQLHLGRNVVLDVETVFPRPRAGQAAVQQARIVSASTRIAQSDLPVPQETETVAKIAVPPLTIVSGMSADEVDAFIEEYPELLQEVEMTFTSSVEGSRIVYECSYSVVDASTESTLLLQIDDSDVHQAVFESSEARYVDWAEFTSDEPIVMRGSLTREGVLESRMTTLNLLDADGAILGTMPIQFLANR